MTDQENPKLDLVNPKTDEDFFAIGRLLLSRSTCLKTQTASLIVALGRVVSWGVNMCCPQDQLYGLPVTECPRTNTKTGTHYELCKPIHAEIVAAINAFGISHIERRSLWHFPGFTIKLAYYKDFFKGKDASLYLLGHYWACEECIGFLNLIGIPKENIKFDNLSGRKTLREYKGKDLTGEQNGLDVAGCLFAGFVTIRIDESEVENFCSRQKVNVSDMLQLPNAPQPLSTAEKPGRHLYVVRVAPGNEVITVKEFEKDDAVREVGVMVRQNAK